MLFLTRRIGQSIMINDDIELSVIEVSGKTVRLGINFPKEVRVLRKEIYEKIQAENKAAALSLQNIDELIEELKEK